MNNFIHRALGHFYCAEEGAPGAVSTGAGLEMAPAAGATSEPGNTTQADLDAINALSRETVGTDNPADKPADVQETPEDKATREAAEKAKAEQVPEKYEAYKLPEGVELDPATNDKFNALAKELGLTQGQAQKLIDLQSELVQGQTTAQAEAMKAAFDKQTSEWAAQAKADPDIGGDKFDSSVKLAQSALTQFAPPEFRELLNRSGLGNHPLMIKTFFKIGQAISEDKVVIPGSDATTSDPANPAQAMFGDVKFD